MIKNLTGGATNLVCERERWVREGARRVRARSPTAVTSRHGESTMVCTLGGDCRDRPRRPRSPTPLECGMSTRSSRGQHCDSWRGAGKGAKGGGWVGVRSNYAAFEAL
jgi:hypothetical protein